MQGYIIEGGTPLQGEINVCGNKNSALPCIAACLLTTETVTLSNVPLIEDVGVMCDIITHLGAEVERDTHRQTLSIRAKTIRTNRVPLALASRLRASFLFAGPLLARTGEAIIPPPGGDVIGRRRLDTHILALEKLGAHCDINDAVRFTTHGGVTGNDTSGGATGNDITSGDIAGGISALCGASILLDEASVTATENAIMAAVTARGASCIRNAACEPHVQDLCRLLVAMGARIEGIGSNELRVEGVPSLRGAEFRIGPDFMEIGSFIGLAAATRSNIVIKEVGTLNLDMIQANFNKLGIGWRHIGNDIHIRIDEPPVIGNDIGGMIGRIEDAPWPGFPADLISIALVVATQARGIILIHEKLYESRLFFVDKLISMGAQIILCDPHRAVINGPTQLRGARLNSPDVRAGMALVIAALCASGTSIIQNVYQIQRGYQNLAARLQQLGARIKEEEL